MPSAPSRRRSRCRPPAALGNYSHLAFRAATRKAAAAFEVQEYRKPEFEVIVTPASRFVVQGQRGRRRRCRRATTSASRSPTASCDWVVNQQPYYSPLRWNDDVEGDDEQLLGTATTRPLEGTLRLDARARRRSAIPLGVDENGRDFSARIEAQVTDAASREVSGSTIVHATYGTFLLSARGRRRRFTAGGDGAGHRSRARLPRHAASRTCRSRSCSSTCSIGRATTASREITSIATQNATTDADGPRHVDVHAAQSHRQLPRPRHRAERRPRGAAIDVFLWVPGPGDYAERQRRSVSRAARGQAELSAGRIGDADRARRDRDRPGARDQGRPARVVVPPAAAAPRRIRSRCRSTTATSATCS